MENLNQSIDEEELEDIRDYDEAKAELERGEDELIPAEVVFVILDGENPVKIWHEFRGLTQQQLAGAAGISKPYLSQIETGKRNGTLAKALQVTLEEVIARENEVNRPRMGHEPSANWRVPIRLFVKNSWMVSPRMESKRRRDSRLLV